MARPKTKQLKQGARRSVLSNKIVERWGEAGGDVALDRLISELGDVQRYDIVAALKELERAGAGEFLVGRTGRKARFVWNGSKARAIVEDARKQADADGDKPRAGKGDGAKTKAGAGKASGARGTGAKTATPVSPAVRAERSIAPLEHAFHLRPGYVVTVRLPADVARSEVERFCQFLQSLPFSGTG